MLGTRVVANRRNTDRRRIPPGADATVTVRDRSLAGGCFPLRDVSLSGLSFVLDREAPGIEAGECLKHVEIRALGYEIRGELLLMHVTPEAAPGAICGGLFYPETDEDLLAIRALVRALD